MADGSATFPFGKHEGQSLDEVASTKAGLRYLDWVKGWMEEKDMCENHRFSDFYEQLLEYTEDPVVSREIEEAIG